jgi:hypothetical protein
VAEDEPDYGCDGCAQGGVPLLEASDGRSLCLACVEADPARAGVEKEAVDMLRTLSRIVRKLD